MDELCLFTGLGKRKRVMDEKELMMPLELGYVQVENKEVSFFVTCEKCNVQTVSEHHSLVHISMF